MAEAAERLMTVAEFLRWDDGTDRRYELVHGRPVMMAPPGRLHGLLAVALGAEIRARLQAPCNVQAEAGIVFPHDDFDVFVADLAVSCTPPTDEPWCPEPVMIVEILSEGTRTTDLTVKLRPYRRLPSLRHLLLVETREPRIEHWRRIDDGWQVRDLGPGDVLRLEDLGVELEVDALYRDLPLGDATRDKGSDEA